MSGARDKYGVEVPCYECVKRSESCHKDCEAYKAYEIMHDKAKAEYKAEKEIARAFRRW